MEDKEKLMEFKSLMDGLADTLPKQLLEVQKKIEAYRPKSSRKVVVNGLEAVASITDGNLVVFDFIDKSNAEKYLNSLQVI